MYRNTLLENFFIGFKVMTVNVGYTFAFLWVLAGIAFLPQGLAFIITGIIYFFAAHSLADSLEKESRARRLRSWDSEE